MTSKNYNSADEKDVANAKRNQHNDNQAEINDLRATMDTSSGRRTIWNLLTRCGVFNEDFSVETNVTYFNLGRRNIGLRYMKMLHEHCHDKYLLMQQEQQKLESKRG